MAFGPPIELAAKILARQFNAAQPNAKWVADYCPLCVLFRTPNIWTAPGWLYVAVVLDLRSRWIVVWSMRPEIDGSAPHGKMPMSASNQLL